MPDYSVHAVHGQEEKKKQKKQQEKLLDTLKKRGYSGFNPEQLS